MRLGRLPQGKFWDNPIVKFSSPLRGLEAEQYFALWRQLEQAVVSWPVDLVELDQEVPFAVRVPEQGEVIYERTDSDPQSGHGR